MEPAVKKSSRSYDSSRRVQSSRARQLRVAEVAGRLIVERGYAGTTMADVAVEAAVSVPWLYKVFGSKPLLVKHAYDVLLAGDADPVPLAHRPAFRALAAETDPRRVVERYAAISRDLIVRVGPLAAALLSAAHSGEPEVAELASTISRERLFGATTVADHLAELGALAPDVTREQARDVIWTLISPEVHRLLGGERGWSGRRYEQWLATTLTATLLGTGRQRTSRTGQEAPRGDG